MRMDGSCPSSSPKKGLDALVSSGFGARKRGFECVEVAQV